MNKELLLNAYTQILRIRLTEERLVSDYKEKNIRSFVHFCVGQEAIAVGVCMNLSKDDYVFGNHRSHGHYLAKGGNLNKMIAELYGKSTGCSGGRGGSMHLIDKNAGFMGSISILGSVVPIAVGAAFSNKMLAYDKKCIVFLGDGASEEGVFYESVNFASLFKIPILFVIENNLYAVMSDSSVRRSELFDFSKVATGLGAHYYKSDGNNFYDVYNTTKEAIKETQNTMRPGVIEFTTFRHMCHSGPVFDDDIGYRKKDDWNTRIKYCPLNILTEMIIARGVASLDTLNNIEEKVKLEIDDAFHFAKVSPFPKAEDLMKGVYNE